MIPRMLILPAAALAVGLLSPAHAALELDRLGSYESRVFDESATEIAAYDSSTRQVYVTNGNEDTVDIIDLTDPSAPAKTGSLRFDALPGHPGEFASNSVSLARGILAVSLEAPETGQRGLIAFYRACRPLADCAEPLALVPAGFLPDAVAFSPDGTKVLSANEGEASEVEDGAGLPAINPPGSFTLVEVAHRPFRVLRTTQLSLGAFEPGGAKALGPDMATISAPRSARGAPYVRIHPQAPSVAADLEPEYVTFSPDGTLAYGTLQENNAVAVIDIRTREVDRLLPLGWKNHANPRNALDANKNDGIARLETQPFHGLFLPDAIAAYSVAGVPFLVTANEGDARDPADFGDYGDEIALGEIDLDDAVFPQEDELRDGEGLGDKNVSRIDGDLDGDGQYEEIVIFGARSFSIWDARQGNLVFDSGSALEQITAEALPGHFNASNDDNSLDDRSDNKGPEPEALALGTLEGRTYAFIGLERVSGIVVYDISNPHRPQFVTYRNDRDFSLPVEEQEDLGPEGIVFVPAAHSPNGDPLLLVSSEVSGSLTVYGIRH